MAETSKGEFEWQDSGARCSTGYLVGPVLETLRTSGVRRILDLGCGNGALSAIIAAAGFEVCGLDASETGISQAAAQHPGLDFIVHDIGQPLPESHRGRFDAVVSTEVIEHLFLPRQLMDRAREALVDRGLLLVSTPYHGYLKNVALSLANKWDFHADPLYDFGHIKFFSRKTLTRLFEESGFDDIRFRAIGRIPALAKSMIVSGRKHRG